MRGKPSKLQKLSRSFRFLLPNVWGIVTPRLLNTTISTIWFQIPTSWFPKIIQGLMLVFRKNTAMHKAITRLRELPIVFRWRILWDLWTQLQILPINLSTKRSIIWRSTNSRFVSSTPIIKSTKSKKRWNRQNTAIQTTTKISSWKTVVNLKCRSLAWKSHQWTIKALKTICHNPNKTTRSSIARVRRKGSLASIPAAYHPPQAIRTNYRLRKWRPRESIQTSRISKKVSKSSI